MSRFFVEHRDDQRVGIIVYRPKSNRIFYTDVLSPGEALAFAKALWFAAEEAVREADTPPP